MIQPPSASFSHNVGSGSTLLVIGGASLDTLHFAGQTAVTAGGAGMYTAMAAWRCGARAALYAPLPRPMPPELQPVAQRLAGWLGPEVDASALPRFEIAHEADETTYLLASFGAELALQPEDLPPDLSGYASVHIVPLGDVRRQLAFLQACRQRGARRISAGTYLASIQAQPGETAELLALADGFFMNAEEAAALFGSTDRAATAPGKLLYVTQGKAGAVVIQGQHKTRVPGLPAAALDPTGAGDTFCGAVLARLGQGAHPVMAAREAMPLAAQMVEQVGPEALLWHRAPPAMPVDARVRVIDAQVGQLAGRIGRLAEAEPFPFTGPEFPPAGHPAALDYFFATTLQQFGFWTSRGGRYHQPLLASIQGRLLKGSSYLFQAYAGRLAEDPAFFTPARQSALDRLEMLALFRADDGGDPMPALDLHLEQARRYGADMLALGLTPPELLRRAQAAPRPLAAFLAMLDQIGGYKEDPLRKKSGLLALILNQRPEQFLSFAAGERVAPVIDYHLMRSCLRTGLIEVVDEVLQRRLEQRQVLAAADEWAVRWAAYQAIQQVTAQSGKSMGAVDWFFFTARRRCPEMSDPECQLCPVEPVCAQRKTLFQPVRRTTFY